MELMADEIVASFKNHVATMSDNTIRFADPKTITRAVEFILSGRTLLVTGDFGVAGYQTSGPETFQFWANSNFSYWADKCRASSSGSGYEWNAELAEHRIREIPKECGFSEELTATFNDEEPWKLPDEESWIGWLKGAELDETYTFDPSDYTQIGRDVAYNVIAHATALRLALKQLSESVHWIPDVIPIEDYEEEPQKSPQDAVEVFLRDYEEAWDDREDLIKNGKTEVVVHGCVQTSEPLPEDEQFDGYVPGEEYWKKNGQSRTVTVSLSFEIGPVKRGLDIPKKEQY
jgi:hypothetical protein